VNRRQLLALGAAAPLLAVAPQALHHSVHIYDICPVFSVVVDKETLLHVDFSTSSGRIVRGDLEIPLRIERNTAGEFEWVPAA